jgi:alanine racemase
VGRVCMDLTAVDVTGLNVEVGDDVELFGDRVLLEDLSEDAGTIPYELIARIHQRVIRVVVD